LVAFINNKIDNIVKKNDRFPKEKPLSKKDKLIVFKTKFLSINKTKTIEHNSNADFIDVLILNLSSTSPIKNMNKRPIQSELKFFKL
jgi:hypothetical protein